MQAFYSLDLDIIVPYVTSCAGLCDDGCVYGKDIMAGIGKVVDGRMVSAFFVRSINKNVYELSGAITGRVTKTDYKVAMRYLLRDLKAKSLISFTSTTNKKAINILKKLYFKELCRVPNYFSDNQDALMFFLDVRPNMLL